MDSRRAGWRGWTFVLLLLISAGMVTVPDARDTVEEVRAFYDEHADVVVVANVVSLLAAVAFWWFASALHDQAPGAPGLRAGGALVAAAAGLTSVPVLVLCAVADTAAPARVRQLVVACDVTDVVLFSAITAFALAVARSTSAVLRAVALVVAGLSAARALLLLSGSGALELVAPMSFVLLVAVLSTLGLLGRRWYAAR